MLIFIQALFTKQWDFLQSNCCLYSMFPVLFCLGRAPGWLAHWVEQLKENEIYEPKHVYMGNDKEYVPMSEREDHYKEPTYTRTSESSNIRKKHTNKQN